MTHEKEREREREILFILFFACVILIENKIEMPSVFTSQFLKKQNEK